MLDYAVYIGRFQPFHNGHMGVVTQAKKKARKVIILVGGYEEPRTLRNPFDFAQRKNMIERTLENDPDVLVAPIRDFPYNDQRWLAEVRHEVSRAIMADSGWTDMPHTVGIVTNPRDNSSVYPVNFPDYTPIPVHDSGTHLRATEIRKKFFDKGAQDINLHMSLSSALVLANFSTTQEYSALYYEKQYVKEYIEPYKGLPYPPTFNTVDALVVQAGHILLVRRGGPLGKGKLALAGGFVEAGETLSDATIRELREETRLRVAKPVLRGSIKAVKTFDDPYRSQLGRVITTVTHFELGALENLPAVHGDDDAEKAFWHPIDQLSSSEFFDDHFHIIQNMLGV